MKAKHAFKSTRRNYYALCEFWYGNRFAIRKQQQECGPRRWIRISHREFRQLEREGYVVNGGGGQ